MRHKHADIIHAWADGSEVQVRCYNGVWKDVVTPSFDDSSEYRIKPGEPKWWENIPEHGILVRSKNSGAIVAIYSRDTNYALGVSSWTPLTNEEIERFKR